MAASTTTNAQTNQTREYLVTIPRGDSEKSDKELLQSCLQQQMNAGSFSVISMARRAAGATTPKPGKTASASSRTAKPSGMNRASTAAASSRTPAKGKTKTAKTASAGKRSNSKRNTA